MAVASVLQRAAHPPGRAVAARTLSTLHKPARHHPVTAAAEPVTPPLLTPDDLHDLLQIPPSLHGALVIDVRPAARYRLGHIPGSHHIPGGRLLSGELPDQDLVLVAESGRRASELREQLHNAGFHRQIRQLDGGLPAWVDAGQPLARPDTTVTAAHHRPPGA